MTFDPDTVITVTFPGFGANRSQMAKYAGKAGLTVLRRPSSSTRHGTSETQTKIFVDPTEQDESHSSSVWYHAVCPTAPLIVHNIFPSHEIVEIQEGAWWNPVDATTMCLGRATAWWFGIQNVPTRCMKLHKVNMGGDRDQEDCLYEIGRAIASIQQLERDSKKEDQSRDENAMPLKRLVLFGCSRGAATMFYTVVNRLPPQWRRYIGMVVLEAPFDTFHNVLAASSWSPRLAEKLFSIFGDYDGEHVYEIKPSSTPSEATSEEKAKSVRPLPFVFVTSDVDSRVPKSCTLALMASLRQAREDVVVEHLALKNSRHSSMVCGDAEDRERYIAFMQQMHEKYLS